MRKLIKTFTSCNQWKNLLRNHQTVGNFKKEMKWRDLESLLLDKNLLRNHQTIENLKNEMKWRDLESLLLDGSKSALLI